MKAAVRLRPAEMNRECEVKQMNDMVRGKAVDDSTNYSSSEWRKSSRSYGAGECVEVAVPYGTRMAVRDSKNPQGAVLRFTHAGWRAFVADVRMGRV
jgi:hypothetical protein